MSDLLSNWGTEAQAAAQVTRDSALEAALEGCERLRNALEEQDPGIGNYLNMINSQLRQFPELVHLLPDELISVVVKAHLQKRLEYLDEKSKPKAKKAKSSANLLEGGTLSDLL